MIDSVTNNTIKDGIALLLYVVGTAPIPTPCHCQVTAPFLKLLSVLKPCLPCLRVRNEGFFHAFATETIETDTETANTVSKK